MHSEWLSSKQLDRDASIVARTSTYFAFFARDPASYSALSGVYTCLVLDDILVLACDPNCITLEGQHFAVAERVQRGRVSLLVKGILHNSKGCIHL